MDTAHVTRTAALRTEVLHVRSGQRFLTDAPVDNQGRGEAISPTDLLAAALAACAITTMEIKAREQGIALSGMEAAVVKHMASGPRRVAKVEVRMRIDGAGLRMEDRAFIEQVAHNCPVALSLGPDVEKAFTFTYR